MDILKSIARKILAEEINQDHEQWERESGNLKNDKEILKDLVSKAEAETLKVEQEKAKVYIKLISAEKKMKDLEQENAILREYYKLDEEPSEDIQLKIHINLEINRLKEELQKQQLMQIANQQQIGQYQMTQYARSTMSRYDWMMRRF